MLTEQQLDLITQGWIPIEQAFTFIQENMHLKTNFILDNWEYKYLDMRVDMRTGKCLIRPGNHGIGEPA